MLSYKSLFVLLGVIHLGMGFLGLPISSQRELIGFKGEAINFTWALDSPIKKIYFGKWNDDFGAIETSYMRVAVINGSVTIRPNNREVNAQAYLGRVRWFGNVDSGLAAFELSNIQDSDQGFYAIETQHTGSNDFKGNWTRLIVKPPSGPRRVSKCDKPKSPTNGYVSKTNQTIGSTVRVGCKPGYFRTGIPPFEMTCKQNGQWSKVKIKCIAQSCGDPGTPRNGQRLGLQFNYLDTVHFTCNHGYVLQGPSSRRCLVNQTWSDTQPVCQPVSCGKPPKVKNSNVFIYGQYSSDYVYGDKVLYSCRPGYKRLGGDFLFCDKDAQWRGSVPNCTELHCSKLDAPANGRLLAADNYTREGESVRYSCNAGFMMFGPPTRKCLSSGRWTGPDPICFKCSEVGTPVFVRGQFYFKHGKVQSKSGHVAKVQYDDGKVEDITLLGPGTQHYIIVEDRIPLREEIFVGSRVLAFNPRLGKYMFATVISKKGKRYVVRYGSMWMEKGVVGLQNIRTREPPRFCATCKDPGRPLHSVRKDRLTEFITGMSVVYTCQDPFKLSGSQKRTCLSNGTWTGRDVSCTRPGPKCQHCPIVEVPKICKKSTLAVIAKVLSRLPNDGQKKLHRYAIDVQYVLKDVTQNIQEGRMVISVPYGPLNCACPRIPLKKKFILIGHATNVIDQSKTGIILDKTAFVAGWSHGVRRQIKLKCTGHVTIPRNIH